MRISDWSSDVCSSDLVSCPLACRKPLLPGKERPACMDGAGSGVDSGRAFDVVLVFVEADVCAVLFPAGPFCVAARPASSSLKKVTCTLRTGLKLIILMQTLYITHPTR